MFPEPFHCSTDAAAQCLTFVFGAAQCLTFVFGLVGLESAITKSNKGGGDPSNWIPRALPHPFSAKRLNWYSSTRPAANCSMEQFGGDGGLGLQDISIGCQRKVDTPPEA